MKKEDRQLAVKLLNEKFTNSRWKEPEEVIEAWDFFVNQIKSGNYTGNLDEYWNDLDTRLIIDEIGYSNNVGIIEIDREFRKLLIHTNVKNWGYDDKRTDDWWNFGYPKTATGYLKEELENDIRFKGSQ